MFIDYKKKKHKFSQWKKKKAKQNEKKKKNYHRGYLIETSL